MLGSRSSGTDEAVTCIACGEELPRSDAREYDKYGDRWERAGKQFEHLCKPCYRRQCHQPRDDLEATLTEMEAGELDRDRFLASFCSLADRSARDDEGERGHERGR